VRLLFFTFLAQNSDTAKRPTFRIPWRLQTLKRE
jgi:hypothetical protein